MMTIRRPRPINPGPLTLEYLKSVLSYDPLTGVFTYINAPARKIKVGDIAGTVESSGYIRIEIKGKPYRAHRLAWFYTYGEWPRGFLDHKNLDKSDARLDNLRPTTCSGNVGNTPVQKDNKLGIKGVCKVKYGYIAQLHRKSGRKYLGIFKTPEEASAAYAKAAVEYFGEFARIA
jgi:hypothetical protein